MLKFKLSKLVILIGAIAHAIMGIKKDIFNKFEIGSDPYELTIDFTGKGVVSIILPGSIMEPKDMEIYKDKEFQIDINGKKKWPVFPGHNSFPNEDLKSLRISI